MLKRIFITTGLLSGSILLSATATAQPNYPHQADSKTFDASVIAIDQQDRTITVRFDQNNEMETYPVAKNAEFYYYDGRMDIEKGFTDLSVGDTLKLELGGVAGHPTLSKVTSDEHG